MPQPTRSVTGLVATLTASALLTACAAPPSSGPTGPSGPSTNQPTITPCEGFSCVQPGRCVPGQASAQFRSQVVPPALMAPTERATVSLSFDNCSGQSWQPGEVVLEPAGDVGDSPWGPVRIPLPSEVHVGERVSFQFELTAPTRSGSYPSSWTVARLDGLRLQEASPTAMVNVLEAADCTQAGAVARFRSYVLASEFMATGDTGSVGVTFSNCSTETWTSAGGWQLHATDDAAAALFALQNAPLPADVPPGYALTVSVPLTAPATPGAYSLSWRVEHGAEAPVDDASTPLRLTVLHAADCTRSQGNLALFVSQQFPPALNPSTDTTGQVTFANCGAEPWREGWSYAAYNSSISSTWSFDHASLPLPVGPGFALTVPVTVHAPGTPADYPWRVAVRSPEGTLLDEPSPDISLTVRCVPQCNDRQCGGDSCGGSCGECASGWSCDGAHCHEPPDEPVCGAIQWWNRSFNADYITGGGWHDTDLNVAGSTPIQLRHHSRLERWGVYAWGYMPEFTDLVTGRYFRVLHLRPQHLWATNDGEVYPAGFIIGLSGGDTYDTGYCRAVPGCGTPVCSSAHCVYSSGQHLCVQTRNGFLDAFPRGVDSCR